MASRYKKLRSFLDDLILEPPTSSVGLNAGEKTETLTLSTVHSAKGLEWPVVFIIWVMEGRFPPSRAYNDPLSLEEERRLLYVAATRAKDQLIICYPGQESMPVWQLSETGYQNGLSSFVRDLPEDIISRDLTGITTRHDRHKWNNRHVFSFQADQRQSSGLAQGDRVNHPAFGPGIVSKLIGDDKVEVLFRNAGRKLLHLEYTTLEKS
jgi:DNA helicase-2/ATP-dependent DNA helicase PcrA